MHEYRKSLIATEMRAIWPDASELDQHIGSIFAGKLEIPAGRWGPSVLVVGAGESAIPAVLGGTRFNCNTWTLCVRPANMTRQWQIIVRARVRYRGRCLAKPMQSPYASMELQGANHKFPFVLVLVGADFGQLSTYCTHRLLPDGTLVVAQLWPVDTEVKGLVETERVFLRKTASGYWSEEEAEEKAGAVVLTYKLLDKE